MPSDNKIDDKPNSILEHFQFVNSAKQSQQQSEIMLSEFSLVRWTMVGGR